MRITILGCGYVGLVSGACLAEIGHSVVCSDNDESKIRTLNQGALPIYEPHLQEIVTRNVEARLSFTADLSEAVRYGDAIFLCVGTPPLQDGDAFVSLDACRWAPPRRCNDLGSTPWVLAGRHRLLPSTSSSEYLTLFKPAIRSGLQTGDESHSSTPNSTSFAKIIDSCNLASSASTQRLIPSQI